MTAASVRNMRISSAPDGQPETLVELIEDAFLRHRQRPALITDAETMSYEAFDLATRELADQLRRLGVGPGDRVGVRVPSGTTDLYVAIVGVLRSGAAYVPVDAEDPDDRAEAVFHNAKVCAVVGERTVAPTGHAPGWNGRETRRSDDAWVIFTSGSTGEPKGVAVSHGSAVAFVRAEELLWTVTERDRVLAGLSVAFDASCEEMWTAWAHGAALVPAPREVVRSGVDLGGWLRSRQVSVVSTVPTLAAMWEPDVVAGLRLLILGGEALPPDLGQRLATQCETWNTYGPTEATVVTTACRVLPGEELTIGWPLAGWQTAVVDEDGRPVPDGEEGELVIGGVGLGRYLDPELDAAKFAPMPALGWLRAYRSGDMVRQTPGGYQYLGRQDDQIKLGGRRIELGEVDAALLEVPGVRLAASTVRRTDAGNPVLVGYVVGDRVDAGQVRRHVSGRLSGGLAPAVVVLDALPLKTSGKVDRSALPWPPPASGGADALTGSQRLVADCWREQLGPLGFGADSDFFECGGSSVAAAKLVSVLRDDFPGLAVADVYRHKRLDDFARLLDRYASEAVSSRETPDPRPRRLLSHLSAWLVTGGAMSIVVMLAVPWLVDLLVYDDVVGSRYVPRASYLVLLPIWLLFASIPGRMLILVCVRRLLLPRLTPGRYSRHSSIGRRLWFVERLGDALHVESFAGTPWAARFARMSGLDVHLAASLDTVPPVTGMASIGAGATVEDEVDMLGTVIEGTEVIVGTITIGAHARVGQRVALMPGVVVGEGAEIEPGSVVLTDVPAGERWAGNPACHVGDAGELWPPLPPVERRPPRRWKLAYAAALALDTVLPLVAALPTLAALTWLLHGNAAMQDVPVVLALLPALAASFVIVDALVVAACVRIANVLVKPGLHEVNGRVGFGHWWAGHLMARANEELFPLFASVFVRPWLRLAGMRIGKGTEFSTSAGLNRLVEVGELCFSTDDVSYATGRRRHGWLELSPIRIGDRSFMGNGAIIRGGTTIGNDCLVGLQTVAPYDVPDDTSWFGAPAIEFPRPRVAADVARTYAPPFRLRVARASFEVVRILLPTMITMLLAFSVYLVLLRVGRHALLPMVLATPVVLFAAGLVGALATIAAKWALIGRYRADSHPYWSTFVWRDEIINSLQEVVAGGWLLMSFLGTPLMSWYLRAMGARVGHDVHVGSMALTEFDQITLDDGCAVNRHAVVETHLFQDRVMQIGPSRMRQGSSIGPRSAILPDTELGEHTHLGMRSVVMRGETLPPRTRWVGAPVIRQ
ncbi:MAG TPA: Pls/PosA family non-ribosomal peptide synthetase [Marmoricola sp.]|nr:Pls/PosA family non-ribosomal peptide synthetase [Marmoricola sp.]